MKINQLAADPNVDQFNQMEVIIDSMTAEERRKPEILNGSRATNHGGIRHNNSGFEQIDKAVQADE